MSRTYYGIWFSGDESESFGWCCFGSKDGSQIDCFESEDEAWSVIETLGIEQDGFEVRPLPSGADAVRLRELIAAVEEAIDEPKDLLPPGAPS